MASGERTVRIRFDGSAKGLAAAATAARAELKAATKGLSDFQAQATAASERVSAAHDAVAKAAGNLRVAELRLQELQAKGTASASQIAAAEERVATARRALSKATAKLSTANAQLVDAQQRSRAAWMAAAAASAVLNDAETKLSKKTKGHITLWKNLVDVVGRGAKSFLGMATSMGGVLVVGPLVLGAIGGIISMVTQLSGVLGLIPGAAAGAAAAFLTIKLGADGIKKAFDPLSPQLDSLKTKISNAFQKGLAPAVSNLSGLTSKLAPGFEFVAGAISS